jgi:hypothetical protein
MILNSGNNAHLAQRLGCPKPSLVQDCDLNVGVLQDFLVDIGNNESEITNVA